MNTSARAGAAKPKEAAVNPASMAAVIARVIAFIAGRHIFTELGISPSSPRIKPMAGRITSTKIKFRQHYSTSGKLTLRLVSGLVRAPVNSRTQLISARSAGTPTTRRRTHRRRHFGSPTSTAAYSGAPFRHTRDPQFTNRAARYRVIRSNLLAHRRIGMLAHRRRCGGRTHRSTTSSIAPRSRRPGPQAAA